MYLWNYVTKKGLTLVNAFITLYIYLTGQSPYKDMRIYCKNISKMNSWIFIMTVINWIFSCLILDSAFKGLLLNTFFSIKSTPVVNTLQDIRVNKQLLIGGHHQYISNMARIKKFDIDDILARMKENKIQPTNIIHTLEYIINGKGVGLFNDVYTKKLLFLAKFHTEKFFVPENKYLPDYRIFFVDKHQNFSKIIQFW